MEKFDNAHKEEVVKLNYIGPNPYSNIMNFINGYKFPLGLSVLDFDKRNEVRAHIRKRRQKLAKLQKQQYLESRPLLLKLIHLLELRLKLRLGIRIYNPGGCMENRQYILSIIDEELREIENGERFYSEEAKWSRKEQLKEILELMDKIDETPPQIKESEDRIEELKKLLNTRIAQSQNNTPMIICGNSGNKIGDSIFQIYAYIVSQKRDCDGVNDFQLFLKARNTIASKFRLTQEQVYKINFGDFFAVNEEIDYITYFLANIPNDPLDPMYYEIRKTLSRIDRLASYRDRRSIPEQDKRIYSVYKRFIVEFKKKKENERKMLLFHNNPTGSAEVFDLLAHKVPGTERM